MDINTHTETCVEFCGVPASNAESALQWLSLKKFAIVIINDWSEECFSEVNILSLLLLYNFIQLTIF